MRAALLGALLGLASPAIAQTSYVTDELRVAVRTGPGDEYRILRMVVSGSEIQERERRQEWIRISLPDGTEGWLSARHLAEGTPARVQLPLLLEAQERDRAKIATLESQNAKLGAIAAEATQLRNLNAELNVEMKRLSRSATSQNLVVGAVIALGGLLVGVMWPRRSGGGSGLVSSVRRLKL